MEKWKQEVKWWVQRVKNVWHMVVSIFFVLKYGYPARKLIVIGVTGTDGKTTTSTLIYEILRQAGGAIKPAMLSTVSVKIGNDEIDTGLHTTNPDARQMQPLISMMVKRGVTHLVLEVTAHGLDQYRVLGCNIKIAVLTNLTHEHLDDFVDMKRYAAAKLRMFKGVEYAVLNKNDSSFGEFSRVAKEWGAKVVAYGKSKQRQVNDSLKGDYNLYNIGAAEAAAEVLHISKGTFQRVIAEFSGVPGRREEVKAGQPFRVFVDFAHTPNALEQVLKALKAEQAMQAKKGKLILVFGATGERDKTKRPMMGEVADRLADVIIVTSDDTRGESQDKIFEHIARGIKNKTPLKENDRKKAIELAIKSAKSGDVVLLAGKGHERSILHGRTEYPWSDVDEAKLAISEICKV